MDLYGIKITELPLPPDGEDLKIVALRTASYVVSVDVRIRGILFRRIEDRMINNGIVWSDPEQYFEGPQILDDDKAADLEAIFHNYIAQEKINIYGKQIE